MVIAIMMAIMMAFWLSQLVITISTRVPLQGALTDFQHLRFFLPTFPLHLVRLQVWRERGYT